MKETITALLFGKRIADKIIKDNPGKNMIFTLENVGDQCMELAYAQSYKEANKIEHLAVITSNPSHPLFQYFPDAYDSLVTVTKKEISILLKFYKSDVGQMYRRKHPEIVCAFYTSYVRSDLLFNNSYIKLSDIEKHIYRIPLNTLPSKITNIPAKEWVDGLVSSGKLVRGNTVLINPYANSCSGVPIAFFEKVAKLCMEKGFAVLTGIHADQKSVKGTNGVDFSLDKTVELVNACGYVIGLRSGFLDLCAFSDAKVISIDHESYYLADATKLEDWWPQNQRIKTFRYCTDDVRLIDEIVEYLIDA